MSHQVEEDGNRKPKPWNIITAIYVGHDVQTYESEHSNRIQRGRE
jgi:hypothetical protein